MQYPRRTWRAVVGRSFSDVGGARAVGSFFRHAGLVMLRAQAAIHWGYLRGHLRPVTAKILVCHAVVQHLLYCGPKEACG